MSPTTPDGKATPADPGAKGLPCVCRFGGQTADGRFDEDMPVQECDLHKALRARVTELEGDMYVKRVHDAEARVAELAGAISAWLEHRHDVFCAQMQGTFDEMPTSRIDEIVQQCEAVLAATPAQAIERAKATRHFIDLTKLLIARHYLALTPPSSGSGRKSIEEWREALTALSNEAP